MTRPLRLFAFRAGREFGINPFDIMDWPLKDIYELMAFFITDKPEFREQYAIENMTVEEQFNQMFGAIRSVSSG